MILLCNIVCLKADMPFSHCKIVFCNCFDVSDRVFIEPEK